MKVAFAFLLLFAATGIGAADRLYLDQIIEMPLATLQAQFSGLRKEGCYKIAADRFLLVTMDKKDGKPWRVAISSEAPCRRPEDGPALDVRDRSGVELGDLTTAVLEKMGRPDASAVPDAPLKRLGDMEFFYICRVSDQCARHTSVYIRSGTVSAVSEWYSE